MILVPCGRHGSIANLPPGPATRSLTDAMPAPVREPSGRPAPVAHARVQAAVGDEDAVR
jgi:hypothetical protein